MRPIGVHLDEKLRAFGQSDAKCIFIRAADPELAIAMQHPYPAVRGCEAVREVPRAVRRGIVDDKDVVTQMPDARDDLRQVFLLVERRQDHQHLSWRGSPLGEIALLFHPRKRILITCLSMSSELLIGLTLVGEELRQTTGTSAIFTPCLRARYRTSGSKPKPSVTRLPNTLCATSARNSLKPHCVSQIPGNSTACTMRLKILPTTTR